MVSVGFKVLGEKKSDVGSVLLWGIYRTHQVWVFFVNLFT